MPSSLNPFKNYEKKRKDAIVESLRIQEERTAKYLKEKELQAQREKNTMVIHIITDISSLIITFLLLKGGMAIPSLCVSLFSVKLLSLSPSQQNNYGTRYKAMVGLLSSGVAYCFDSRSVERVGGVFLVFIQLMSLQFY